VFVKFLTESETQPGYISPGCVAIQQSTKMKGMEAFRGKVVYLDFWATWCPPCRKSMPALNQLRNELEPSGFEVVAINLDEKQDDAKQYLKKYPVNYPIIFDSTASCAKVYELKGMPTSYLIDRQGVIRDVHVGYRQGDIKKIRSKAQALLEEKHD
jgi:thiol-disulfide isomerase/thioredoxin